MELLSLFICLRFTLGLIHINTLPVLKDSWNTTELSGGWIETAAASGVGISAEAPAMKCKLKGNVHLPAFSVDGDYVVGGVFSIHHYMNIAAHDYTTMPEPLRCTGRLV